MKIKEITLKNFRSVIDSEVVFSPLLPCVELKENYEDGVNFPKDELYGIVFALKTFLAKFGMANGKTNPSDMATLKEKIQYPMVVNICTEMEDGKEILWQIAKDEKKKGKIQSNYKEVHAYTRNLFFKVMTNEPVKLPFMAYYGKERKIAFTNNRKIKKGKTFSRLDGYRFALKEEIHEELMLQWYLWQTLIEYQRKSPTSSLNFVRNTLTQFFKLFDDDVAHVKVGFDLKESDLNIRLVKENQKEQQIDLRTKSNDMKDFLVILLDVMFRMAMLNPQLSEEELKNSHGVLLIEGFAHNKYFKVFHILFPNLQIITTK